MKPNVLSKLGQRTAVPPISWLMQTALTRPRLISLAAGFTDNSTLPVEISRKLLNDILRSPKTGRPALQYGITAGETNLRALTAKHLQKLDGGLDHLREVIIDDSLGLAADFEAAMQRHVDGYVCEWKAVLDDPDKLARFVSFVNAPGAPDPTVEFTEKNGRKIPVLIGTPTVRSR